MPWILLVTGIVMQALTITCMKLSAGFSHPDPALLAFVFWGFSFTILSHVLKGLSMSWIFPVHAGAGIALVACIGFVFLGEHASIMKVASIGAIVIGVAGLSLAQ